MDNIITYLPHYGRLRKAYLKMHRPILFNELALFDKLTIAMLNEFIEKILVHEHDRKGRLHQNYLKRKASGAQKRYDDKIKERKKAEIEAEKAAIRAEDIAKGVFVPVSSLPQREPMKGVQTA